MAKFRDLANQAKKNWSAEDHALYERAAESFDADAKAQVQLGKQIAALREAKHLTQKDLSNLTGVQQAEISRIERGLGNPTTATVSKLARAFDKELTLVQLLPPLQAFPGVSQHGVMLAAMVKFDPDGFKAMMARIEAEQVRSPYEDLEPDYEFMPAPWCNCHCHQAIKLVAMTDIAGKDEQHEFLKIQELADLFRISRSTAFRMMKDQGWPRHEFGTEIRFSAEDIEAIRVMNHKPSAPPKVVPKVGTRANRRRREVGE